MVEGNTDVRLRETFCFLVYMQKWDDSCVIIIHSNGYYVMYELLQKLLKSVLEQRDNLYVMAW